MAEIIIEGHKVDTKDIWDIVLETNTRSVSITVKITDKPDIFIGRNIPYETRSGEFNKYWGPYELMYKSLKEKWEADKSDMPVFKL